MLKADTKQQQKQWEYEVVEIRPFVGHFFFIYFTEKNNRMLALYKYYTKFNLALAEANM